MTAVQPDRERGTVTVFVTITIVAMLMAAGLVLDGGRALATRREAIDVARAAARAGAQAVDTDALRRRTTRVRPAEAAEASQRFLRQHGYRGEVTVWRDRVRVSVALRQRTQLLTLVGLRTFTVSGSGEARIVRGVTRGET